MRPILFLETCNSRLGVQYHCFVLGNSPEGSVCHLCISTCSMGHILFLAWQFTRGLCWPSLYKHMLSGTHLSVCRQWLSQFDSFIICFHSFARSFVRLLVSLLVRSLVFYSLVCLFIRKNQNVPPSRND